MIITKFFFTPILLAADDFTLLLLLGAFWHRIYMGDLRRPHPFAV